MVGSSGASRKGEKRGGAWTTTSWDPHCSQGRDGALTVDPELDAVLLGPGALALAQEDALVMGGDVSQGQSRPLVLEVESMLVLPRLTLALALPHPEDECWLLLVDLWGGGGEEVRVLGLREGRGLCLPPLLPSSGALTENQSTWLKLLWEWEGPHFRRAVPPTSTSSSSGAGFSASPGTPGGGAPQQLSAPAALHALPSQPLAAAALPATSRI